MILPLARPALWRNRHFAKRVAAFAKRVASRLPGLPIMAVAAAAAALAMTVAGAFHTGAMPLGQRAAFWTILIGGDVAKWQLWFAWRVRRREDWAPAAAIGLVPLNLVLPLEIEATLWLFGIHASLRFPIAIVEALAISAAIFGVMTVVGRRTRAVATRVAEASAPIAPVAPCPLARIGIASAALLAIRAEDHYCRFHLDGGSDRLVLFRFGDALAAVAALDGAQVHRSAWVADRAVASATRDGRRWRLTLADGTAIPVSPRFAAAARARGWFSRE